jgi:SnoaL-like domain
MTGTGVGAGDPAAVIRRWLDEVWMAGDLDAVDELVAPRYVRHGVSGTVVRDRAGLKEDLRHYFRVLHKPVITVDDQAVAGDRVWMRMTIEGVDLEAGTTRLMTWLQVFRVDDEGRLAESWVLHAAEVDWRSDTA